jgi:hypothetical protein
MKSKIKKILLDNLKSEHDGGNIDDGSITGGDNTVDQLYDLFVDEATFVRHLENPEVSYPPKEPKDRFSRFAGTSLFPDFKPKKKAGEILYTNPKTGKTQKLFDTLESVYGVRCSETVTIGDKGCSVSMNVAANSEEEAIAKVMKSKEFTKHIRMKDFDKKYLTVYKPVGNYVINDVNYHEGDERL